MAIQRQLYSRWILWLALFMILTACGPSGSGSSNTSSTTTTPTDTGTGATETLDKIDFTAIPEPGATDSDWQIKLDASSTTGVNYQWAITDSTGTAVQPAPSGKITSINLKSGNYTIQLTVTDAEGRTGLATKSIQVGGTSTPINPIFTITDLNDKEPTTWIAPATIKVDASNDPTGESYDWAVTDSAGTVVQTASGMKTLIALLNPGIYTIKLTIKNATGKTGEATQIITLEQSSTVIPLFSAKQKPNSYDVLVDASNTTNENGMTLNYAWEVQDSQGVSLFSGATGQQSQLPLSVSGLYTILLTVTDNAGNTFVSKQYFNVKENIKENNPLLASIAATPTKGPAPLSVLLDGSGSVPVTNSSIAAFNWVAVDNAGNQLTPVSGEKVTMTFPGVGVYTVTLTVTDANGETAATTEQIIVEATEISTTGSKVAFTVKPVVSAQHSIILDANGSHMNNAITQYDWSATLDANVVQSATGAVTTMGFEKSGTYIITLTITDSSGSLTGSQTVAVP